MPKVELEPCPEAAKAALAAMFQLYVHDFSEQWAGTERGELQEDGTFPAYPHLDSYWREPRREPLLIRADGRLAGFALINDHSHSGLTLDYAVAEFFVVRKHRRSGVGRSAARVLMTDRPGRWELAIARTNPTARAFWRRIADELAEGEVEEIERADDLWNGPIIRLQVG